MQLLLDMPSSAALLDTLAEMSHRLGSLAIAWHVAIAMVIIALLAGWWPSRRVGTLLVAAPAASVAIAAIAFGNPFNAVSFAVLAGLLAYDAFQLAPVAIPHAPRWASTVGAALVAFGWSYPHFVTASAAFYAAPIGIVPCPTLAVIAGFTLLADGFGSRAVPAALTVWTAFYALFGIVRLGVMLDLGLVVATGGLAALLAHNLGAVTGGRSRATGGA